jgi:hypothetical protein
VSSDKTMSPRPPDRLGVGTNLPQVRRCGPDEGDAAKGQRPIRISLAHSAGALSGVSVLRSRPLSSPVPQPPCRGRDHPFSSDIVGGSYGSAAPTSISPLMIARVNVLSANRTTMRSATANLGN